MRQMAIMIAVVVLLLSVGSTAQEARSEVSLQGTGLFTKDSTGRDSTQRGTENGGFLVGYRYHFNRWLAAEGVYGYGRNTQQYFARLRALQDSGRHSSGDRWLGSYPAISCEIQDQSLCPG